MQTHLQRAYYVLVALVLLTPLYFSSSLYMWFGGAKTVAFLILSQILFVVWVYFAVRSDELHKLSRNPIVVALLVVLLIQILSSIFGVDPVHSFFGDVRRHTSVLLNVHLFFFLCATLFLLRKSPKWANYLTYLLISAATVLSIHGLLEVTGLVDGLTTSSRAVSVMGNPIFLASFLIIPFFISLGTLSQMQNKFKHWSSISTIVIAAGILATGTRGALVGVVAGLLVYLGQYLFAKRKISKTMLLKIGIGLALVIAVLGLGARFDALGPLDRLTSTDDSNVDSRLIYWGLGLKGGLEYPFLGVGNENYYVVANKYYDAEQYIFNDTWVDKPHNSIVEIFVSNGILGLLAFLVLIGLSFKYAWKDQGLLAPALVAFLVQNLFVFDTISASIAFYFLLVLIILKMPEQDGSPPKHSVVIQVGSVLVALTLFFIVTVPSYRLLHAMGSNGDIKQTTHELQPDSLIYDYGNLANLYYKHLASNPYDEEIFNQGKVYYEIELGQHPLQATFWFYYAQMHINKAVILGEPVDEVARKAVETLIDLAPGRLDGRNQSILIKQLDGDLESALAESIVLHNSVPSDPETSWILAQLYVTNGQIPEAVDAGLVALNTGIKFGTTDGFLWLIDGLASLERYDDLLVVYEKAIEMFPDELKFYYGLAATYAELGDIQQATQTAQKVMELDPENRASAQAFIDSLSQKE